MIKKILILVIGLCSISANAGLKFTPIQLYINEETRQRSATITLESTGITDSKIFEVSAVKWTRNEKGEDIFEKDNNILINPKNFVIKPESKQVVRIGFSQPIANMNLKNEQAWRVFFTEVAPVVDKNAVKFLFNVSVPLFVGKQDELKLNIQPDYKNNELFLNIKNNSNSHVQITKLTLLNEKKEEVVSKSDMRYMFSGEGYSFNMGNISSVDLQKYKLEVTTDKNSSPVEVEIKGE
ncbi:fimbrial biogenesis chaperone [Acinetobacter stercoris]|uniref:Pili assembly chaperone N-terminal domain-containing protein n=1 Tax=Acinetobacter stercoris TaxID=2126983 RepID=A0A2U3MX39_9GAMM|nr:MULTISPECIES: fimbria/pilus periplasmic chaperone [Acinetobacter]SPL69971.1 hypothetical protein KPC_1149 [Acinetobacter stercoris]